MAYPPVPVFPVGFAMGLELPSSQVALDEHLLKVRLRARSTMVTYSRIHSVVS